MRRVKIHIDAIHRILRKEFERNRVPVIELIQVQTGDPFKVLVSTILSARTRDETTTQASRKLYQVVTTPRDLAKLSVRDIERYIYPVGFYKNKARFLKELPAALEEKFGGKVPETVDDLVKLPGVGRKTANLVVAVGFNKPAVCVDIHVHRITNRLGYVKTATPFETEMALRAKLPQKYWITFNSYLVSFGQHLCFPRNPRCDICPIYQYCNQVGVVTKYARGS